jgi:lipoate-protein ligase A
MTDIWHVIDSGAGAADYNMALDDVLLGNATEIGAPVVRFYGWKEPAATFGYSQHYKEIERLTRLRPLIRRPTGGGLVPHDADWTYSMAFPAGSAWHQLRAVESYERVHAWIREAFAGLGVETTLAPERRKGIPGQCFVGAEKHDVLWQGRKIAGAAQRRTKAGLLIQGSVQPPPLKLSRLDWQRAMLRPLNWKELLVTGNLAAATEELRATKYSLRSYNEKR